MLIKQGMLRKEMEKKIEKSYGFLNNSEKNGQAYQPTWLLSCQGMGIRPRRSVSKERMILPFSFVASNLLRGGPLPN